MTKQFPEDFGPGEEMTFNEAPPLADPENPDKVLASQELYDLADEIVHLSMLEMKELVNKIGDHFGFEKPPFTGSAGAGGAEEEDEASAEVAAPEKKAFDLKLVSFDAASKIKVIKEVRAIANLGLKEAKDMVEGAPKTLMKDINRELAEELAKKLEEVGATVEIV
jgi:large subunit ribosomal protein L7/L12